MKQLHATTASATENLTEKVSVLSNTFNWMVGRWRLFWNYCPECNSCAPKIHSCDVCNCDTKSFFHWSKEVENTWWNKYVAKHNHKHLSY